MRETLILASISLAALASAQSPMAVARKAAADYQNATMKKDFASFEKSSTPDFVYIDGKGRKATRAQALGGMKSFYGNMTIKSVKIKALSAKAVPGGVSYVQESWTEGSMTMGGPKPSKFSAHSRDEVTMVKRGGKWLTKSVKNLMMDDRLDGKKMPRM